MILFKVCKKMDFKNVQQETTKGTLGPALRTGVIGKGGLLNGQNLLSMIEVI